MTDPHDPLDDALRDALRAEAAGVEADPRLLDDITAVTSSPDPTRRRPGRLLAVAAAFVVAAGTVAVLTRLDDDGDAQRVEVVDDDGSSTTAPPDTSMTVETVVTQPVPMPTVVAVVQRDGQLVRLDLTTGEVRPLAFMGDMDDRDPETQMLSFIDDVEISPDGQWAYFSHCCEPALGEFYRVSMTDPDPRATEQGLGTGRSPRVRPDGSMVAAIAGSMFILHPGDPSTPVSTIAPGIAEPFVRGDTSVDGQVLEVVWSPDGSQLAALVSQGNAEDGSDERRHLEVFGIEGYEVRRLGESIPIALGNHPAYTNSGQLIDAPREYGSPRLDASRQWELTVEEGGGLFYKRADYAGGTRLLPSPAAPREDPPEETRLGGSAAVAADW